jgi:hypothetical protein
MSYFDSTDDEFIYDNSISNLELRTFGRRFPTPTIDELLDGNFSSTPESTAYVKRNSKCDKIEKKSIKGLK